MKKVARLRMAQMEVPAEPLINNIIEQIGGVRTTGRIKKPKAVFDPSDNYLPRSNRTSSTGTQSANPIVLHVTASDRKKDVQQEIQRVNKKPTQNVNSVLPPKHITATLSNEKYETFCSICLKKETKRNSNSKNKLISCVLCKKKVHKMCLLINFENIDILTKNYHCDKCRSCDVCSAFNDDNFKSEKLLITCAKCVKSFHPDCHIPNVHKFQQNQKNWKCNKCSSPTISNGGSVPATIICKIMESGTTFQPSNAEEQQSQQDQQQQQQEQEQQKQEDQQQQDHNQLLQIHQLNDDQNTSESVAEIKPITSKRVYQENKLSLSNGRSLVKIEGQTNDKKKFKPEAIEKASEIFEISEAQVSSPTTYRANESIDIPDVKDWTVDQVVEFFGKYFPNEAFVFKDHEIDGMSLLLLKRSDVVKKLPIKLGPSLRIYSLILKIQTQLNDPTLGWSCSV